MLQVHSSLAELPLFACKAWSPGLGAHVFVLVARHTNLRCLEDPLVTVLCETHPSKSVKTGINAYTFVII